MVATPSIMSTEAPVRHPRLARRNGPSYLCSLPEEAVWEFDTQVGDAGLRA